MAEVNVAKQQGVSFEQSMSRLETIVDLLERGDCDLDQSLKLFEEGATLAARCEKMLDEAEQKVTILLENGKEAPFQAAEG